MKPADDPYTPPLADEGPELPDAPLWHGWAVRNGRLWVEDGAVLPMIDPYTGGTADRMTLVEMVLLVTPRWLALVPLLGAAIGAMAMVDTDARAGALWGAGCGVAFHWLTRRFRRRCRMGVFMLPPTALSLRLASYIRLGLAVLSGLLIGAADFREPQSWWPAATAGGAWLILFLHATFLQRRLVCRRTDGGRFEIRGVHPLALAQMIIGRPLPLSPP